MAHPLPVQSLPPIAERLLAAMDGLPAQLRAAARWVLDHPRDVALLSMREQARRAGLPPATLTRLAQRLGLRGFEDIRALHAEAIRHTGSHFAGRAGAQATNQRERGDRALAAEMVATLADQVACLADPAMLAQLAAAARDLQRARTVFCLGRRSSFVVAWHLSYILSLYHERVVLLDDLAGRGADPLRSATSKDLLVGVSISPYTQASLRIARRAHQLGVPILALTDSVASPLARIARHPIVVPIHSPSFFHTLVPALAMAELLATLAAGRCGAAVEQALQRTEIHLAALGTYRSKAAATRPLPARPRSRH